MRSTINLRQRYGQRYRITMEESYFAQYGPRAQKDDPCYQIIPGGRGHVYAWSDELLAASTNGTGNTATKLRLLPFVEVWLDGSDGCTVLFREEHLDEIAAILRLRRRRRVSAKERERLLLIGQTGKFQAVAA